MAMGEVTYRNSEWEIEGALICAELELIVECTISEREPSGFTLYTATWTVPILGNRRRTGARAEPWLIEAMKAWVRSNQEKLKQAYYDARLYDDADFPQAAE